MSSIGPNNPGTVVSDATWGSVSWSNPDNAKVSDDAYAISSVWNVITSEYLKATNFGFSIPAGATIKGIVVEIEESETETVTEDRVRIVKSDDSIGTTERSAGAELPTTDTYITYGSSSDLWGETWTSEDINNSNFGVVFAVAFTGYKTRTAKVDHIRITVYYTALTVVNLNMTLTIISPTVEVRSYTAYRVMQIQGDLSGGVFTQNLLLRKITDTEDDS